MTYEDVTPNPTLMVNSVACVSAALLPHDLLDLADLFLYFAGSLFVFAFGFQIGIHADFPGYLLDLALHFVKLAFRLVLRAGFHGIPPVGFRFDCWAILFRRQGAGSIQNVFPDPLPRAPIPR